MAVVTCKHARRAFHATTAKFPSSLLAHMRSCPACSTMHCLNTLESTVKLIARWFNLFQRDPCILEQTKINRDVERYALHLSRCSALGDISHARVILAIRFLRESDGTALQDYSRLHRAFSLGCRHADLRVCCSARPLARAHGQLLGGHSNARRRTHAPVSP
eukprot:6175342-Pleurochrysis_carterae.AAC.9